MTVKSIDNLNAVTMDAWFSKVTAAERDAMSAMQLDYRFRGDNLGSEWWLALQSLGFQHNGTTYNLPDSAPAHCRERSYTGAELYEQMDRFAIPQLTSPFQEFPPCTVRSESLSLEEQESKNWWRSIRDEMIFRRFRSQIEGFQLKQLPPATSHSNNPQTTLPLSSSTNKRRATSKDAGAELFMRKPKQKMTQRTKKGGSPGDEEYYSKMTFPTIQECAQHVMESSSDIMTHVREQETLLAASFDEWQFQTAMNHSLLVYGIGSKRNLLNQFAEEVEAQGKSSLIVVDGFHKDATIEGIFNVIEKGWLRGERLAYHHPHDAHVGRQLPLRPYGAHHYPGCGDVDVVQKAVTISRALALRTEEYSQRPYYFILHNIDGEGLRNATAQEALAALVANSNTLRGLHAVRLVASVDHINSPALLWDSFTCSQFRWIWKPAHTHRPHVEELTLGTHADEKTSSKAFSSHRHGMDDDPTEHKAIFTVLSSLAPRHTEALQQLAGLQANQLAARRKSASNTNNESSSSSASWVPYKTLFRQCQHKCIVHADDQLRRFLQELTDHGVVEQSNSEEAEVMSYRIPHAVQTLKDILEFSHNSIS